MKTFEERKKEADAIIEKYLRKEDGPDKTLIEAMNYSVRAGGKRLRPILLQSFGLMYGAEEERIEPFMAAIEMIHTYSLVHDDLPAMDNDMLRRGQPTTHAKYGAGMATLAGDGLLSDAHDIMCEAMNKALLGKEDPSESIDDVISAIYATSFISHNSGVDGMVGGQSLDVETDKLGRDVTGEELTYIYSHKTSALIIGAMMAGAVLGGSELGDDLNLIGQAGNKIGYAFQIRDDILDIEGDEKVLGKETGQDERNGKSNFVTIHGIENSEEAVEAFTEDAKTDIANLRHVKDEEERLFVMDLFDRLTERNH
ncbi:MAG: polyprenyl synthetase family protein [Lachnospiraceae bacterium]|nr:polyprenyl synthetase family protein [Lachnospiraceae bacterium]MDD7327309.1 polyprenyl synthetase family protein [Lachnospiraceae bacterium]MDY2759606.1 polyprenyl synthetase family protein [Lachnospiraceae bacterium]